MKPQTFPFLFGKLNHKISWETFYIPLNGLVKNLCFHIVQPGQIEIQHYPFAPYFENPVLYSLYYLHVVISKISVPIDIRKHMPIAMKDYVSAPF